MTVVFLDCCIWVVMNWLGSNDMHLLAREESLIVLLYRADMFH
jgi:hypothetical protein